MLDGIAVHSSFDHIRSLAHINAVFGKITLGDIIIFLLRVLILIVGKFYFVSAEDRIPCAVESGIALELALLEKGKTCINLKLPKEYRILLVTVLYKGKQRIPVIKLIFSAGVSVISAGLIIALIEIIASAGLIDRKEQKLIGEPVLICIATVIRVIASAVGIRNRTLPSALKE